MDWDQRGKRGVAPAYCWNQRKYIYIENRAGKAASLASWKKLPSQASYVGDGSFRVFPVRAHFPRNETLEASWVEYTYIVSTPSTVTSTEYTELQPLLLAYIQWWG
jgi:hypothetical protein